MLSKVSSPEAGRVDSLDYLRGLAATGVLLYHMHLFSIGEVDAAHALAKVKIYAVSIFYILSGLTLYLVYADRLQINKTDLLDFYTKRFFRIVPLLWLVTLLTVVVRFGDLDLSWKKSLLNVTIVPGIVKPQSFLATGAWSIGNELFFYLVFPVLIILARWNRVVLLASLLISLAVFLYFTYMKMDPTVPLGDQWSVYVNPLNQVFFFALGVCLGVFERRSVKYPSWIFILSILLATAIMLYPINGEPVVLVSGTTRIILSLGTAILCFLFYKTDCTFLPGFLKQTLHFLGQISYSLYLLHPIVFYAVMKIMTLAGVDAIFVAVTTTIFLSILLSYICYTYFEKYFMNVGKNVSKKLRLKSA